MIYINSKGEEVRLENLNDFHLMSAARKADEITNFLTGVSSKGDPSTFRHEEWGYVERYINIVRHNLWVEVDRRDLQNPIKEHFLKTFPHLEEGDKTALWNFMKSNFSPKK